MENRKETGGYFKKLKIVLIVLSIFAAVKMLFFAFGLDEEYQLVMAYRHVKGDKLFLDMWEPHQSSTFLCELLMRPYLAVCGKTGVVIWLRLCGTLIHLGVSVYLCRTLRRMIGKDSAFLLGLIYFNTIPKQIMLPEFGIMQVWFLTLLSLFLIRYYDRDVVNGGEGVGDAGRDISTGVRGVGAAGGGISTNAGGVRGVGEGISVINRYVRRKKYLIFAAFALVLEVLSYPSCLLLYFLVMWILWRRSGKDRFADMGIFTGICAGSGIAYLGLLLRNNTVEGLIGTLSYIVGGDITHSLSFADKLVSLGRDLLVPIGLGVCIFVLAKAGAAVTEGWRKARCGEEGKGTEEGTEIVKESEKTEEGSGREAEGAERAEIGVTERRRLLRLIWTAALSCLVEIWYWVVFNAGYEGMQIHLAVFAALGISYYVSAMKKEGIQRTLKQACRKERKTENREAGKIETECIKGEKTDAADGGEEAAVIKRAVQRGLLFDQMILSAGALVAVVYLTDLGLMDSLPHAMTAAFFGMTLVIMYWEERGNVDWGSGDLIDGENENTGGRAVGKRGNHTACISAVLLLWAFTAVFGKGYTLRSGTGYHNVLQSGGVLKHGPAAGTISDYMCAYIYNCDYEDWQSMIRDGDRVLIMVDQVMNLGTIQYLFKDVEISHYSIVNPTAYDERLLAYWEKFPEKQPNVIIVDDWYGQLMTDQNGWLMRYAEGEFGYTSMEEGRYIRIYRKE